MAGGPPYPDPIWGHQGPRPHARQSAQTCFIQDSRSGRALESASITSQSVADSAPLIPCLVLLISSASQYIVVWSVCVCVLVALSYVPVGLIVYVVVGDKDDEAITIVTYHSSYEV